MASSAAPSSAVVVTPQATVAQSTSTTHRKYTKSSTRSPGASATHDISIVDKDSSGMNQGSIIAVSVLGGVLFLTFLSLFLCRCRKRARHPKPLGVPAAGGSNWNNFRNTHGVGGYDDDKSLTPDDKSVYSPPMVPSETSASGASTPTQGLLRALDQTPTHPSFLRPYAASGGHGSTPSLASTESSANLPNEPRYPNIPIPPIPDLPSRSQRHGHSKSASRHSVASTRHSIHSIPSHQTPQARSTSRLSLFTNPSIYSGPTPTRSTSIRGAPHKTGIQIILPQPLGPSVYRYSSRSPPRNGNNSPLLPPASISPGPSPTWESETSRSSPSERPRGRDGLRFSKPIGELSPVLQSPSIAQPDATASYFQQRTADRPFSGAPSAFPSRMSDSPHSSNSPSESTISYPPTANTPLTTPGDQDNIDLTSTTKNHDGTAQTQPRTTTLDVSPRPH